VCGDHDWHHIDPGDPYDLLVNHWGDPEAMFYLEAWGLVDDDFFYDDTFDRGVPGPRAKKILDERAAFAEVLKEMGDALRGLTDGDKEQGVE
jgi:hypothetical protein